MDSFVQFFRHLLGTEGFASRDFCRSYWPPYLVTLHNWSDLAIFAAYLAIPLVLLFFYARGRERLPFSHLLWLFAVFILSCGLTHFMEFFTSSVPMYRLSGLIKLVTALSSWGTVLALVPVAPLALSMKTPDDLEKIIAERTAELERREAALRSTNERLEREVAERKKVEELLREEQTRVKELNLDLEQRVKERTSAYQASNTELESFAYSVAHDLRGPLRAIDGLSYQLIETRRSALGAEGVEDVERIRGASRRMDGLISALLKLSRVTRQAMRREKIDLSRMAIEIVDELQTGDPDRSVQIKIADDLECHADPNLVRVLLSNLLSNAWKFTSKRTDAKIEFGSSEHGVWLVRDNGAGFRMEHAGKLFQPFERLHPETAFAGTGIGLATCQRVVAKHHGRIWAESQEGRGTTFYFTLS